MRRAFFASELDTTASWWRIYRCDGVTLGFTTHDRDLWFDGIVHRAAPGTLPSAIRVTSGFEDDPGDIEGALSHASVTAAESLSQLKGGRGSFLPPVSRVILGVLTVILREFPLYFRHSNLRGIPLVFRGPVYCEF